MGPKQQRKADLTPSKEAKKQRVSSPLSAARGRNADLVVGDDNEVMMRSNMAASSSRKQRLQFTDEHDDEPPNWFCSYEQRLNMRLEKLDFVAGQIEQLTTKVENNEKRIDGLEYDVTGLNNRMKSLSDRLTEENKQLYEKIDDLENRGRRINLVFHHVPEKIGTTEDCLETMTDIINNFVGFDTPCSTIVERCHRSGQQGGDRPRIIHVAFSSYMVREKVRKACIAKFKESSYHGVKLGVGEDFSKRVSQLRKAKMPGFKQLKEEGKQPFFVFPAALKYRVNGRLFSAD